jgi:hypothetical protein
MCQASCLVKRDAASLGKQLLTFQRITVQPDTKYQDTMTHGNSRNYVPSDMVASPKDWNLWQHCCEKYFEASKTYWVAIQKSPHRKDTCTMRQNYRSWRQSTLNFLRLGMAYFFCHEYTQMFCVWHTRILINPSTSVSVHCTAPHSSPVAHLCALHGPPFLTSRSPLCTALTGWNLRKPEFKPCPGCKVVGT